MVRHCLLELLHGTLVLILSAWRNAAEGGDGPAVKEPMLQLLSVEGSLNILNWCWTCWASCAFQSTSPHQKIYRLFFDCPTWHVVTLLMQEPLADSVGEPQGSFVTSSWPTVRNAESVLWVNRIQEENSHLCRHQGKPRACQRGHCTRRISLSMGLLLSLQPDRFQKCTMTLACTKWTPQQKDIYLDYLWPIDRPLYISIHFVEVFAMRSLRFPQHPEKDVPATDSPDAQKEAATVAGANDHNLTFVSMIFQNSFQIFQISNISFTTKKAWSSPSLTCFGKGDVMWSLTPGRHRCPRPSWSRLLGWRWIGRRFRRIHGDTTWWSARGFWWSLLCQ